MSVNAQRGGIGNASLHRVSPAARARESALLTELRRGDARARSRQIGHVPVLTHTTRANRDALSIATARKEHYTTQCRNDHNLHKQLTSKIRRVLFGITRHFTQALRRLVLFRITPPLAIIRSYIIWSAKTSQRGKWVTVVTFDKVLVP